MGLALKTIGITKRVGKHEADKPNPRMMGDVKRLFRLAQKTVLVVSGKLPYSVYCANGLMPIIKAVIDRGVRVSVIVGPDAEKRSVETLLAKGAFIYQLSYRPKRHFLVVDEKHVRLEEPHETELDVRTQWTILNYKYANKLAHVFLKLMKQAQPLGSN